jgi:F-type H+-transporting ATPase subunit b
MHEESLFEDPRTWVAVAFVIFFVLFGRKLWTALTKMLDARATAVRAELDEASRLRREAEAMLKDAETRRAAALKDAEALIEGAKQEAIRVAAAATQEAEHASARREKMAMDRIAAAEKTAVDSVRFMAAEIATEAARQVISEGLSQEGGSALVDNAIAQLPAALARRAA